MPKHAPKPPAEPESAPVQAVPTPLEVLEAEAKGLRDQLLRTMAEFQNFRKRVQQESEQYRLLATEKLVTQLLPVLDNFERTIAACEEGAPMESVLDGIRAVERQLRGALEANHLRRISAEGHPFDPDLHEAIAAEPSEEPEGTIIKELEAGYRLGGRVLRPSRVKVSRKP
ncbi:MAG: nucleotide exchange factor GrpE [Fimbriimonas ginsengisoli]|uniref:Protein GrpE n=1 Tax=Fimbriimonas ginsengisoli TaxID=1005039 RepID=A0A931LTR2_FIMGI|nr:nucleotide exchange factor GrpE [Fimbriimonas ginsengisoli]